MNTNNTHKRRGRVKGSSDSTLISVADLAQRFAPTVKIPVRRTWLDKQAAATVASETTPASSVDGDALPPNLGEVEVPDEQERVQFQVTP